MRGKVLGFMVDTHPDAAPKARERFALAHRYVQRRPAPRLLITSGVVGSGKSTVARAVAARLGAIVVRTDAVRKRLVGLAPTERGAEEIYTQEMSRRTYDECLRVAGEILAAGWSVIVDGTFTTAADRARARALASRSGVPLVVMWCDAPDAVLADRLRRRAADPDEVSDAGPELLVEHRARYERPDREPDAIRVDTAAGPDAAVETALRALSAT